MRSPRAERRRIKLATDPEARARKTAYNKKWWKDNPEKVKKMRASYRASHMAEHLFYRAQLSARRRGLPFDLSVKWVEKRLKPMTCGATGIALSLKSKAWKPSIDRKRSDRGYTKRNSQIVCFAYNMAKHTWDHDTVMVLVEALVAKRRTC